MSASRGTALPWSVESPTALIDIAQDLVETNPLAAQVAVGAAQVKMAEQMAWRLDSLVSHLNNVASELTVLNSMSASLASAAASGTASHGMATSIASALTKISENAETLAVTSTLLAAATLPVPSEDPQEQEEVET